MIEAVRVNNNEIKASLAPAGSFYRRIGGDAFQSSGYADTLGEKISHLICNEFETICRYWNQI